MGQAAVTPDWVEYLTYCETYHLNPDEFPKRRAVWFQRWRSIRKARYRHAVIQAVDAHGLNKVSPAYQQAYSRYMQEFKGLIPDADSDD